MGGHPGGERASAMVLDLPWKKHFSGETAGCSAAEVTQALPQAAALADKAIR